MTWNRAAAVGGILVGVLVKLVLDVLNGTGQLLLTTPVLEWQNFVGILAASYTVAGKVGVPRWAVDVGAVLLAAGFLAKLAYVSATKVTEAKDRI